MTKASPASGESIRRQCRRGEWSGPTAHVAPGYAQANLVILQHDVAADFLLYCQRNPRPCPLLSVLESGRTDVPDLATAADLRTDLPRYRIWKAGELVDEPTDIQAYWRDDFVSFLIGCSFTFDHALLDAGLPVRHIEQKCNVPMYRTNLATQSVGVFQGPLVVSMRPMSPADADSAAAITRKFPGFHGEPIHIGDAAALGIDDLSSPDFGDPVEVRPGETPVFWACGVTPQCALMNARLPLAITHAPGHMFVTDRTNASVLAGR